MASAAGDALAAGALDRGDAASVAEAVDGAAAVFVAAPVGVLPGVAAEALAAAGDDCVVTDVGSTKRTIVERLDDERFIGGHPLAGAETAGVRHARADLFDGATWYLTPTARTRGTLYERLHRLLSRLGARPAAIDAETHDRLLATVSHLPHVLANVLVAQAAQGARRGERLPATGPSFRDITRVAGANTAIWRDIYLANADALVAAIDDAMERLGAFRALLDAADGDAIAAWNDGARERPAPAARGRPRRRRGHRAARLRAQPPGRRRRGRARARPRRRQHRRHGALPGAGPLVRLHRPVDRRRAAATPRRCSLALGLPVARG